MKGRLHAWNLAGVAVLAVLCAWQWTGQRRLELDRLRLERLRLDHESRLEEQTRQVETQKSDLAFFRRHIAEAAGAARTLEQRLAVLEREVDTLRADRDAARDSLTNWVVAVRVRDEHLERAAAQLRQVVEERDALAARANEVAGRQNQLVEQLNTRTREFNELAVRYQELAKAPGR